MHRGLMLLPLVVFLGMSVFLFKGLFLDDDTLPSALIGKPLPVFNLPSVEDDERLLTATDLKGPALVNVWGTWCVACRVEHPYLNRLAREGVVIHGINYKDDNAAARRWLQEFHDPYQENVVDKDGRLGIELGVYGAPETFLIDADGVIRYKFIGVVDDRVWENELGPRYYALLEEQ